MLINAYFIVGNIGETEEQMLSTASFARSLGVDLIHVSRLRNEPYSGLRELVEQTPGYHIDAKGRIYSDACSAADLRRLQRQINRDFYTPAQIARVGRKGLRNGALGFLPAILPHLPRIAVHVWRSLRHRAKTP